jgi:hypothetical protein
MVHDEAFWRSIEGIWVGCTIYRSIWTTHMANPHGPRQFYKTRSLCHDRVLDVEAKRCSLSYHGIHSSLMSQRSCKQHLSRTERTKSYSPKISPY